MKREKGYRILFGKRWFVMLIWAMLSQVPGHSQFFSNGQDPASLRWYRIDTDHYRFLFPEDYGRKALYLANLFEHTYSYVNYSLHSEPRKITVIVHNQSTNSNGMVVWAPRRVEIYPVTDPASYPDGALQQLAKHELRHVVQMEKLNEGLTKVLSYFAGDLSAGGLVLMIPSWYMEGDAVVSETALSYSGRGRLPSFEKELRAMVVEKGKVMNYNQAIMDSYKKYIPDKYQYGYQVVAYSRMKYGAELWDNALDNVAKRAWEINPVTFSLHKQAGFTKRRLYDTTFGYLRQEWVKMDRHNRTVPFRKINRSRKKNYTSYRFPRYLTDSVLLAEKSGIDQIREFVLINRRGDEKVVHVPGYYQPVRLSAARGKIVWVETIYDPRWENRTFSDIKIYDIKLEKEYRFTRQKRYFSPDISPDGKRIAVVRVTTDDRHYLEVLDITNGRLLHSFHRDGSTRFFMPTWRDDRHLLVIFMTDKGKGVAEVDLRTGRWTERLAPSFADIQSVAWSGRYLLFHSTYGGVDNIFARDTLTGRIYRVTGSRFGATDVTVSPDGKRIAFSDYTADGYDLGEKVLDPSAWLPLEKVGDLSLHLADSLLSQEKEAFGRDAVPDSSYTARPYRRFPHLFKIHSWLPFYFDYENISMDQIPLYPGVVFYSQNFLSTMDGSVGYAYMDGEHKLITHLTYRGKYPVFDLNYSMGGQARVINPSSSEVPDTFPVRQDLSGRIYLPLNLTTNRFSKGFVPSLEVKYSNSFTWSDELNRYRKDRVFLSYRIYTYSLLKMGHRDIRPRLGYLLDMNYLHSPWDKSDYGEKAYINGNIYLPGVFRHHSLVVNAGYEKQKSEKYYYLNKLPYPRGYEDWISEQLRVFRAEYDFPLFYPDFSVGTLLYVPRFRAQLFFENAWGVNNYDYFANEYKENKTFTGLGAELFSDFMILRIDFPFTFGFWGSYLPDEGSFRTGFHFSVNIYGLSINRQQRPLIPVSPGVMR